MFGDRPADPIENLADAAALVRDALVLLDCVEGVDDGELESGTLKVIASGRCIGIRVEILS